MSEYIPAPGPTTRGATDSALNANGKQLSDLGRAVQVFQARYAQFKNLRDIPPEMMAEYNSIATKARAVEASINAVLGGAETVKGWIGLGAFPIVAVGVAVGAATTILAVSTLIREFMLRVDAARIQRNNPGMTAADALRQAQVPESPGFLSTITNNLTFIALAVGVVFLLTRK